MYPDCVDILSHSFEMNVLLIEAGVYFIIFPHIFITPFYPSDNTSRKTSSSVENVKAGPQRRAEHEAPRADWFDEDDVRRAGQLAL